MEPSEPSRGRALGFAFSRGEALLGIEESQLFVAEDGEVCLTLAPCWSGLLNEISHLGPVALITHHSQARLVTCQGPAEFGMVPGSTTWVELNSGLSIDTRDWLFALAVEERVSNGALFGLQFFDRQGAGQLKVLLTSEANLENYLGLALRFGLGGLPPTVPAPHALNSSTPPSVLPDVAALRALWPTARHDLPGRFFPGLPGVTRRAALETAGDDFARPLSGYHLVAALLYARRENLALRCTLFNDHLSHTVTLRLRHLERCPCALHIIDEHGEFHLLTEPGVQTWVIRQGSGPAVELITDEGDRVGLLSVEGTAEQQEMWEQLLRS